MADAKTESRGPAPAGTSARVLKHSVLAVIWRLTQWLRLQGDVGRRVGRRGLLAAPVACNHSDADDTDTDHAGGACDHTTCKATLRHLCHGRRAPQPGVI